MKQDCREANSLSSAVMNQIKIPDGVNAASGQQVAKCSRVAPEECGAMTMTVSNERG